LPDFITPCTKLDMSSGRSPAVPVAGPLPAICQKAHSVNCVVIAFRSIIITVLPPNKEPPKRTGIDTGEGRGESPLAEVSPLSCPWNFL
jgi:hypothetical protein